MMLRRYTLAAAFLLLATGIAAAQIPDTFLESLEADQTALVIEVVDGDTVVLSNGRQVRLVGIQAPKLPLGRPGFEKWPMADEAKQALSELVLGKNVTLAFGGQRVDRYNRLLAHLFTGDGGWVQGRLLERGLARVYSFTDNRALVKEMLNQEVASRMKRDGIWTSPPNSWGSDRLPLNCRLSPCHRICAVSPVRLWSLCGSGLPKSRASLLMCHSKYCLWWLSEDSGRCQAASWAPHLYGCYQS